MLIRHTLGRLEFHKTKYPTMVLPITLENTVGKEEKTTQLGLKMWLKW
jgi:hypothetical protein